VVLRDDQVLLVERGSEPLKGFWSLPGGALEVGERAEEAIQREVEEETGLKVEVGSLVTVFERVMHDAEGRPEYHFVILDYLCESNGAEPRAADDVARARWVRLDELDQYRMTEGALQVIRKGVAMRGETS
jgi:mutator protein MutT